MPILLVFAIAAACLRVPWPKPLFGDNLEIPATFTATVVILSIAAAFTLRTWVVRTLRCEPSRRSEVGQVYGVLRRRLFFMNIGMVAASILVFGWGWFVNNVFVVSWNGEQILSPFAELLVPLPYFIILVSAWLIYYDSERALHTTTQFGSRSRDFWTRWGYFLHHLRQFVMLVMLPVMLFVTQQTLSNFFPEWIQSDWYRLASIFVVLSLILFMPLVMKPLLGLQKMPAGPLRSRLEQISERLHFKYRDFLLWPTHGAVANAMIVGLLPRIRYVIFTDRILEDLPPEEVDAVFGHEVGHAKHGHIWSYLVFLGLSITTLGTAFLLLGDMLMRAGVKMPEGTEHLVAILPLVFAAAYFFLVFGFLSRRCERQADVYGCRSVSCNNPACRGHDDSTVYPDHARGLCPTGIRTFMNALQHVEMVNGVIAVEEEQSRSLRLIVHGFFRWVRSWQHSTISRRVAFLRSLIENPMNERVFQRRVTVLRWGLIVGIAAVLFILGQAVGWQELLQVM